MNTPQTSLIVSEDNYRTLVEKANVMIVVVQDGFLKYCNPKTYSLSGYNLEDFQSKSFLEFIHQDDQAAIVERYIRRLKGEVIDDTFYFRLFSKIHGWTWVEVRAMIIEWDGKPAILDMMIDITDRKKAEDALKDSEKKYRGYFNQPLIGIAVISIDGRLIEANDKLCNIFGYTQDEMSLKHWRDLVPDDSSDKTDIITNISEVYENTPYERRYKKRDGTIIITEISIQCIRNQDNSPEYYIAVIQDITERKKSEEMLIQALKSESIGRLAGGIAHDLNNLITPIMGYSEMLLGEINVDDPRNKKAAQILKAAESAKYLIQQILTFGRKQNIDQKVVNLNAIINNFKSILSRTIRENIEIRYNLGSNIGYIFADTGQIEQIIMNLVVNSQDALPGGGTITLITKEATINDSDFLNRPSYKAGRYIVFEVYDTGEGIEEHVQEHIFEPFFTTKSVGKGTGLGLATVKGIVEQHEGFIEVESKKWRGTRFRIYIPRVEKDLSPSNDSKELSANDVKGGETIIIAEDNEMTRNVTVEILEKYGYNVLSAENAYKCKETIAEYKGKIDLLITDVIMMDMNGKDLYEELSEKHPNLKVLYMSGYTSDVISYHGVIRKETYFIPKPFSANNLISKVREVLSKSENPPE